MNATDYEFIVDYVNSFLDSHDLFTYIIDFVKTDKLFNVFEKFDLNLT